MHSPPYECKAPAHVPCRTLGHHTCLATHKLSNQLQALSNLSPYLHFGQLSAQRAALEATKHKKVDREAVEGFLEEAVVRRELSDNFCFYEPNYDSIEAASGWAKESLEKHKKDKREYTYTLCAPLPGTIECVSVKQRQCTSFVINVELSATRVACTIVCARWLTGPSELFRRLQLQCSAQTKACGHM